MKNEFSIDEKNEQFIRAINFHLNDFSFEKYKNKLRYPVSVTRTSVNIEDRQLNFSISCRLSKDDNGVLKDCTIYIKETGTN